MLMVEGRVGPGRSADLCAQLGRLLAAGQVDVVVIDVGGLVDPDLAAVEAVARLQLTARRAGTTVELRQVCERLRELLRLVGLHDVVPCDGDGDGDAAGQPASAVGGGRQPEVGEQGAVHVEEVVEPDDPSL